MTFINRVWVFNRLSASVFLGCVAMISLIRWGLGGSADMLAYWSTFTGVRLFLLLWAASVVTLHLFLRRPGASQASHRATLHPADQGSGYRGAHYQGRDTSDTGTGTGATSAGAFAAGAAAGAAIADDQTTAAWSDTDQMVINPANGLPMVGGTGGVDVAGNPYGADLNDLGGSGLDDGLSSGSLFEDSFSIFDDPGSAFDDSFTSIDDFGSSFDDDWS